MSTPKGRMGHPFVCTWHLQGTWLPQPQGLPTNIKTLLQSFRLAKATNFCRLSSSGVQDLGTQTPFLQKPGRPSPASSCIVVSDEELGQWGLIRCRSISSLLTCSCTQLSLDPSFQPGEREPSPGVPPTSPSSRPGFVELEPTLSSQKLLQVRLNASNSSDSSSTSSTTTDNWFLG